MTHREPFSGKSALLCHDWLTGMRGGEKVLEILCDWFPEAHVCTLICNEAAISETIKSHTIHTSRLQRLPGVFKNYRYMLPLFPSAIASIDIPEADLMISTSHCVAKGFTRPAGAKHLCYCFTPMRYAWLFQEEYLGRNPLKRLLAAPILSYMRSWDKRTLDNVDMFVGISSHVSERISRFYGRNSETVFPPVDTERFTPAGEVGDFDLIVSALVPYKKVDLAVAAYAQLDRKLKIAGTGTELNGLRQSAPSNVEFLEWQSDDQILDLYRTCRLLVFPGEEDFGIVPVEAQACGKPVVAYRKGGVLETVTEGKSGLFFDEQTPDSLANAVLECAAQDWQPETIRNNALRFSTGNFIQGITACIKKLLG